jgi:ubiquitin C-terminal hydrolase
LGRDVVFKPENVPEILVLNVGRTPPAAFGATRVRLPNAVRIPVEGLKFGDKTYRLHGYINHSGSAESGHYTATVRDKVSGTWYNYNDLGGVNPVAVGSEVLSSEATIIVYLKV